MSRTTIVLVTFNSRRWIAPRLSGLAGESVVVVDNASSDGTADLVERDHADVRLIRNAQNRGYGRAANQGVEAAETEYAMILNPDVELGLDELRGLEEAARTLGDDWLFVAPETDMAPRPMPGSGGADDEGRIPIEWASGAALLCHVGRMRALGGFDENIFLFFEETDLCRRATGAGLSLWFVPAVRCRHEPGTSTPPDPALDRLRRWHYQWSALYFARKHRDWGRLASLLLRRGLLAGLQSLWVQDAGRRNRKRARAAACLAFMLGRRAFLPGGEPRALPRG